MSIPKHRTAGASSYFVSTKCWQGRCVFQVPEMAEILVESLFHYRDEGAYLLHEFVVMPDHLHLLLTPGTTISLEKAMQFIKGGSSRRVHKLRGEGTGIWQNRFHDWTIRDVDDWNAKVRYIRMNPMRASLVAEPEDWPYSSANGRFAMNPTPHKYVGTASGAKAPITLPQTAG